MDKGTEAIQKIRDIVNSVRQLDDEGLEYLVNLIAKEDNMDEERTQKLREALTKMRNGEEF